MNPNLIVFDNKCCSFVCRKISKKYLQDCVGPTVKHGSAVFQWWFGNVLEIIEDGKNYATKQYSNILKDNSILSGKRLIGGKFYFYAR